MRQLIGATALSLILATLACNGGEPEPETPADGVLVQVAVVVSTERPARFEVVGTVRARHTAVVSSRVPSYIRRVLVDAGERVRRGMVLVELDDRELAASVAQAEAGVAEVGDAIDEATHGREAAQAQLALAESTHARFEDLLDKDSVSQQEFDEVTARLRGATAAVEAAEARLRQASAQRTRAEAQLNAARAALGYMRITAPTDGLVTTRHLDPGSLATPGTPILTLEESGPFELEIAIPASRQSTVAVDQEVQVAIDSLGATVGEEPLVGRLSEVVPAVDWATRTFVAKIELPSRPDLRSGMFGRAMLEGAPERVLEIPVDAVTQRGQLRSVFTVEEAIARRRLVTLGERTGGRYAVLSGLNEGDRVVLSPEGLRDGATVQERQP